MNAIRPIAETEDTVTLRRSDFDRMMGVLEDAEDIATLQAAEARERAMGTDAARADNLPSELLLRLIGGQHPVRIWREQRGLTTQALAVKAGISRSYLAEIESRRKPGSSLAYRRLATALAIPIDDLIPDDLVPQEASPEP